MPSQLYPNSSCLLVMDLIAAGGAPGKLGLFKAPFLPGPETILADLTAIEADFGGYVAGGEVVAAWLASYLDPAGGASAQIATVQWDFTGAPDNLIYGWFYTVTGPPVALIACGTFDDPIPMGVVGNSLPLSVKFNFGAGQ